MSPKTAGKATKAADNAANPEATESRRLTEAAFDAGLISRTRCLSSTTLPPTKLMLRADGKDIVKKASNRKGRYMLVFNLQLAPAAAGKLGTLARLDSKNPVMYLEFPQGRYKLFGTLVFPRNKYMVLRMGQKEVLCEDVMENMVVFSEGWWIGTLEENPDEKRMLEPDWLASPLLHQKYDFTVRGPAAAAAGGGKEAETVEDEEDEDPVSQRPQRRASRAAGGKKRLCYNEDSDGSSNDDDDTDAGEEAAPHKLTHLGSQQRQHRKAQAKQQPESPHLVDREEDEPVAGRAAKPSQGTLDTFFKKGGSQQPAKPASKGKAAADKPKTTAKAAARSGATRKRKAPAAYESEDGDDFVDLAGSSSGEEGEEEDAPPSSVRPRSQRQAAGAAAKKLCIKEDNEDSQEEDAVEEMSDAYGRSEGEEEEVASDEGSDTDSGGVSSDYAPSD